jgi:hypothetical protein
MSIEAALAANTAAINGLVEVWSKLAAMGKTIQRNVESGEQVATTAGNLEIQLAKVEAPKPAPTPTATVTATPDPAATAPAESAVESPSEVTYDVVAKATLAKMKTDKAAVLAAVAKFGAKNAKELKPEQYADFLKEIA